MMNVLFRPVTPLVGAHFLCWSRSLKPFVWLGAGISILIPITAWAQTSGRDPLDTRTATPPPVYDSAFTDYKPYQEPEIISWKAANDVVREFGGMASMKGMDDNGSAHGGHKAEGSEQSKPPAQPSHDGSHTTPTAPAATPPAAPSTSKPAEMKSMPGHDMSKMPQKTPANAPKPAPKPAAPVMPNSMPDHGGMHH